MTLDTKGWVAQMDNMPGATAFRVSGSVMVGHPGIQPTLSLRKMQDKSFALALELTLETDQGIYPQVVTQKPVSFNMPGDQQHPQGRHLSRWHPDHQHHRDHGDPLSTRPAFKAGPCSATRMNGGPAG